MTGNALTSSSPRTADAPTTRRSRRGFVARLTGVTAGGFFIDGYVLGGIGAALPFIQNDLSITPLLSGLIGASALIGIFLGSPVAGWLTDRVGRRPMFTIDLVMFLAGSILQFFVTDAWQLLAVRLLMGLAIGADYAVASPLLAEFAPAKIRGRLLSTLEVAWYLGFILAYALGYLFRDSGAGSWRWILASSAVPAAICLLARQGLPESARWLISKGRHDEAMAVMRQYDVDEAELADMQQESTAPSRFATLFDRRHRRATAFASIFWAALVLPYFAIFTFAPEVLSSLGLSNPLAGSLTINGLALLGSIAAMLVVDRIGRRKLLLPSFWITTATLVVIGVWSHAPIAVIVVCFTVFAFFNAAGSVLVGVYPQEIFPTEVRTSGTGFASAASRVGAAIGTFLLPLGIAHWGTGATMLIGAGVLVVGAVVSHLWAAETNGLSLTRTVRDATAPATRSSTTAA